jgi:hypothetical protein
MKGGLWPATRDKDGLQQWLWPATRDEDLLRRQRQTLVTCTHISKSHAHMIQGSFEKEVTARWLAGPVEIRHHEIPSPQKNHPPGRQTNVSTILHPFKHCNTQFETL